MDKAGKTENPPKQVSALMGSYGFSADTEPGNDGIEHNSAPGHESVGEVSLVSAIDSEQTGTDRPVPQPERLWLRLIPVIHHERYECDIHRRHIRPKGRSST